MAIGILLLVLAGVRGDWGQGLAFLAILWGYAAVLLLLGRRSETVALLGGDSADERRRDLSTRATAFAGRVLVAVTVAMFVWEVAQGRDGMPYAALAGIGGASFVAATVWYAHRS